MKFLKDLFIRNKKQSQPTWKAPESGIYIPTPDIVIKAQALDEYLQSNTASPMEAVSVMALVGLKYKEVYKCGAEATIASSKDVFPVTSAVSKEIN